MEQHADLNREMLLLISSRIEQLEDRLDHLAHTDSKTRVVDFIQDFAKEFGQQMQDQLVVGNFLKNKEIAQLTYTSRQTVNAVMNQLKRSGQIDFNAEYIFLKNRTLQLV
jgi:CRP-like cAMP-binding protein